MKKYYTTGEAAVKLGLSGSRVRMLCKQGRIRLDRCGKNAAISPEALAQFAAIPRPKGRPRRVPA